MKTFLLIICFILFLTTIILLLKVFQHKRRIKQIETQILKILRHLRYGQFNVNLENFKNETIKIAAEKMLESLKDRESMLAEYKQILLQQNKTLQENIEKEKESQKFKDDFIAALTHDLKTPVIAELNAIKMLLAGTFDEISPSQKEVLEMMLNSDRDLIELSEMLLQTYKYQQTELILKKTPVELNSFVAAVFKEMYPILNSKNQNPVLNLPQEEIIANIDVLHFKRVLHNLILNATKYGFSNTDIEINIRVNGNSAEIDIINIGETINKEDIELIFQKYYTGVNKFSAIGTGLGLYCVNKIVKAHNGDVKFENRDTKNIFTVILPTERQNNE